MCALVARIFAGLALIGILAVPPVQASCGAVQCFIVIGSQQQVPQKGLLTVNGIYNNTPMRKLDGTSGIISAVDQTGRSLILDHHQETRTITQMVTMNLNYGVTDRFGLEMNIPYLKRTHKHIDGLGEDNGGAGDPTTFSDNGIGDIRVTAKYNVLPTLRSMVVMGFGVDIPTGDTGAKESTGGIMESPTQLGRGNAGLIGSAYQTYELIPHQLNQFAYASYRHTFKNNEGYQFGDEYLLNVGLNYMARPWLTVMGQFNYRYLVHDIMSASLLRSLTPADAGFPDDPEVLDPNITNRGVTNTGSTYLAFTPGLQVGLGELVDSSWVKMTSLYFYSQIPMVRDSNNNLAQGTSFIFGMTRSFQLTP